MSLGWPFEITMIPAHGPQSKIPYVGLVTAGGGSGKSNVLERVRGQGRMPDRDEQTLDGRARQR